MFTNAAAVTPSDSVTFAPTTGLYIGVVGDVKVTMASNGSAVTFKAVPAGTILPIAVSQVFSTGTTATNITALR